ncbi:MAG: hypothetical protein ACTSU4_09195 [Promethearchaeota archaeon]
MIKKAWVKYDIEDFLKRHDVNFVVENAPQIKYSMREKEHVAYSSLWGALILISLLIIFIIAWFSFFFQDILFLYAFIFVGALSGILIPTFLRNYFKSNISIIPLQCWLEIHEAKLNDEESYTCLSYYPIFSGKRHPNRAKDILLKLYRDEIYGNRIDITQVEIYFRKENKEGNKLKKIGYFFQYGKNSSFWEENVLENPWRFFPAENYPENCCLILSNWMHQYEWEKDLLLNPAKEEEMSPWNIKTWKSNEIKPLTEEFKKKIYWKERGMDSYPKLKPWKNDFEEAVIELPLIQRELKVIEDAIEKIMGNKAEINILSDIDPYLSQFKTYFRDLNFQKTIIKRDVLRSNQFFE